MNLQPNKPLLSNMMNSCDTHSAPILNPDNNHIEEGPTPWTDGIRHSKTEGLKTPFTSSQKWERALRYPVGPNGWNTGLYAGLTVSTVVLVLNVVILVIGSLTDRGFVNGIGTIGKGQSNHMVRLSTTYHVLIHVCSTALLTSSNYAMQLLCASTRGELDQAHRSGYWLEIGLMSFRNLRYIDRKRTSLWFLLAISSAPLHLL